MVGSVNKTILVGNLGADPESKPCKRCGKSFGRNPRYSQTQWQARSFCSRKCGATKRSFSDQEVIDQYEHGHSSTEIGQTLGISGAHVLRILRSNGVKTRPASENKQLSHSRPSTKAKLSAAAKGRRHGEAAKQKLRDITGPDHPLWRAGLTLSGGYLVFTASKDNGAHAGRAVHQIVAEWKHGRRPLSGEHVHHIDGNKLNNHPDNLTILTAQEHALEHGLGRKKAC